MLLAYVESKSLFFSTKSFNFDLVLTITYFDSFTSTTTYSLSFFTFCLTIAIAWNIFTILLFFYTSSAISLTNLGAKSMVSKL
jgi:hypothetical protein